MSERDLVIITGGSGFIGSALVENWRRATRTPLIGLAIVALSLPRGVVV